MTGYTDIFIFQTLVYCLYISLNLYIPVGKFIKFKW